MGWEPVVGAIMLVVCAGCGGQVVLSAEGPDAASMAEGAWTDATLPVDATAESGQPPDSSRADAGPEDATSEVGPDSSRDATSEVGPDSSTLDVADAPVEPEAGIFCGRTVCGPEGNSECVAGNVATCVVGDGGCLEWSAPAACPQNLVCAPGNNPYYRMFECVSPSCTNGVKDNGETSIDCGGPCPACVGDPCTADPDCATDVCSAVSGVCIWNQCADHRQDGLETDVDCGGANICPRCLAGRHCAVSGDCALGSMCDPAMHTCT
jgi:hypothetical protein